MTLYKITLIGVGGQRSTVSLSTDNTLSAEDISTFYSTYSSAGMVCASSVSSLPCTPTEPGAESNLDRSLEIPYKNSTSGKNGRIRIPSPTATGDVGKHGERLTPALAQVILDDWVAKNGVTDTLVAKRGVFKQKL